MSVISEKSHRRLFSQHNGHHRSGFGSSRSDVEVGQHSYLIPRFSAAASEGVKLDLDRDDNWAENTTVVTGATSEHSYSGMPDRFDFDNSAHVHQGLGGGSKNPLWGRCSRFCWLICAFFVSTISLISAPLMAGAPFLLGNLPPYLASVLNKNGALKSNEASAEYEWPLMQCEVDCQGSLLNMTGKTALLILAFYVLYWRRAPADMPRLYVFRAVFVLFTLFVLVAFWLFYMVRIVLERNANFLYIVQYALSLSDLLLFIHCIWIFFELRQLRPVYMVTIVRDPDGESYTFQLGQMSIQEASVQVLRLYHTNFSTYNPYLDSMRQSAILSGGVGYRNNGNRFNNAGSYGFNGASTAFKLYDIEGRGGNGGSEDGGMSTLPEANARILVEASLRRRMNGHNNDVLYAEVEYDKRLNKRRCRLIGCAEECFAHFQAAGVKNSNYRVEQMDPSTAAKAVFSSLARPLNRYLRFTRQQPYHAQKYISAHLEKCLAYHFSARTFLQRFFSNRKPLHTVQENANGESKWSILCDAQASSQLYNGVEFVLRSHSTASNPDPGVQLHCTFALYPFYNITEQQLPSKSKFELRIVP